MTTPSESGPETPPAGPGRRRRLRVVRPDRATAGNLVTAYRQRISDKRDAWIIRQRGGRVARELDGTPERDATQHLVGVGFSGQTMPQPAFVVDRWAPAALGWPLIVAAAYVYYAFFSANPTGAAFVTALVSLLPTLVTWVLRKVPLIGKKVRRMRFASPTGVTLLFLLLLVGQMFGPGWTRLTIPAAGLLFFFYELTEWNRDLLVLADGRHMHTFGVLRNENPAVKYGSVSFTSVKKSLFDKFLGLFGLDVGTLTFETPNQDDYGIKVFGKVLSPNRKKARMEAIYDGNS